ncbi:hemolysin family protein [uncultured Arthrobacter sp.]|uniref:hemolysin family protein n=1 Tax=uncultured Arthrobacter sp. TaxID=114050 RepID=UPI00260936C8|nr:hemolysin family protein [uncultured Arthrobacter sp.]
MDIDTLLNALLVLVFVLIGGVFAGTEMAIVNLREGQIKRIEESGASGAKTAKLVRNPNLFLSAVQIGVTLAGFFSSAYGASTLAPDVAPVLEDIGVPSGTADTLALIGMTLVIAYLSLVLGELAPKRLAMQRAVGFTKVLAPPLNMFARLMRPVIWLLSVSTNFVVKLVGGDPNATTEEYTAAELRQLVQDTPDLHKEHRQILSDAFSAGERLIEEVKRPRTDVEFLPETMALRDAAAAVRNLPYTRYPVYRESIDDVVGFIHIRDLLTHEGAGGDSIAELARPILAVPGSNRILPTLTRMRREGHHIALVVDEYGGTDGIATLEDLLEELVGEIYDEYDDDRTAASPEQTLDGGGVLELEGGVIIEEASERLGVELPDDGQYETLAGLVLDRLGRMPIRGDSVEIEGLRFEVVAMASHRIEGVRVTRIDGHNASGDEA